MHARRNNAAKHPAINSARCAAVAIAERSRFPTLRWKPGTFTCSVSEVSSLPLLCFCLVFGDVSESSRCLFIQEASGRFPINDLQRELRTVGNPQTDKWGVVFWCVCACCVLVSADSRFGRAKAPQGRLRNASSSHACSLCCPIPSCRQQRGAAHTRGARAKRFSALTLEDAWRAEFQQCSTAHSGAWHHRRYIRLYCSKVV
jgi:hypothetical protein